MARTLPIVLLDCDDVVARCMNGMAKRASELLGRQITEDDITTWDFHESLPEGEQIKKKIFDTMSEPGWCLHLEPFPGAVEGVHMLQTIADVFFVTSSFASPTWAHEREAWLLNHFDIPRSHIVHTSAKFLVRGQVFVDDRPKNLIAWRDHRPREGVPLLWDRPHNRENTSLQRVFNWEQVFNCVKREFYP